MLENRNATARSFLSEIVISFFKKPKFKESIPKNLNLYGVRIYMFNMLIKGGGNIAEEIRRNAAVAHCEEIGQLTGNQAAFAKAWAAIKSRKGIDFEDACLEAGMTNMDLIKCMKRKLIEGEDKNSPTW